MKTMKSLKPPRARVSDIRAKYKLTVADIAEACSCSSRTVRRWSKQTYDRRSKYDWRIRTLERVLEQLDDVLDRDSIRFWLREPNPMLDYRSPLREIGETWDLDVLESAIRAID